MVADFNVDGKPDVVVMDRQGFSVLLGNGDGSFQSPTENVSNHGSAVADDFNMDGKPDLAIADPNAGSVQLFIGAGDGTFQLRSTTPAHYPHQLAAGDLNGDGKPDLVASVWAVYDDTLAISVLMGNGDGTFRTPVEYAVGSAPVWVQVADINGDGKQDVVSLGRVPACSVRPWQVVAAELAKETDNAKILALTEELERALEERDKLLHKSGD